VSLGFNIFLKVIQKLVFHRKYWNRSTTGRNAANRSQQVVQLKQKLAQVHQK